MEEAQQPSLVFSVSEVSLALKRCVEATFGAIKVRGEISGLKVHTSGHAYFTLKDQEAVLDGVCWRGTPLTTRLVEGLEVVAFGRLTTYPGRSKYQMVVTQIQAAGEGALLKLLMERKAKLANEGLFDNKRPLPFLPQTIGVITSATGAVIQDILHRITDRFPCRVLLWPVQVQGQGAAEQITAAINGFNALAVEQRPDVLIVARGGGSLEDLWAFNEENVVRAAAASRIPLISAVGHETDTTLIDFAADKRAPTPTAAAEMVTPVLSQLIIALKTTYLRLMNSFVQTVEYKQLYLNAQSAKLIHPNQLLETLTQRLDDWEERLCTKAKLLLHKKQTDLQLMSSRLQPPRHDRLQHLFQALMQHFSYSVKEYFNRLETSLYTSSMRLDENSYQKILEKGFCLIQHEQQVIRGVNAMPLLPLKTPLCLNFSDGAVLIDTYRTFRK